MQHPPSVLIWSTVRWPQSCDLWILSWLLLNLLSRYQRRGAEKCLLQAVIMSSPAVSPLIILPLSLRFQHFSLSPSLPPQSSASLFVAYGLLGTHNCQETCGLPGALYTAVPLAVNPEDRLLQNILLTYLKVGTASRHGASSISCARKQTLEWSVREDKYGIYSTEKRVNMSTTLTIRRRGPSGRIKKLWAGPIRPSQNPHMFCISELISSKSQLKLTCLLVGCKIYKRHTVCLNCTIACLAVLEDLEKPHTLQPPLAAQRSSFSNIPLICLARRPFSF